MFYLSDTLSKIEQNTFLSDMNPERVWGHLTYPTRNAISCPEFRPKENDTIWKLRCTKRN